VLGNALLLRELAANLIHNAIQHAGAGARVTVRTLRAGNTAVLEVEDDGPGLPADEVARAWDRFYRGRSASGLGAGLGLAIVRDIARAHSGQAVMRTGDAGRGVVVRVSLPLAPEVAA
jgi:two-component system sensor histidine kinase TctE